MRKLDVGRAGWQKQQRLPVWTTTARRRRHAADEDAGWMSRTQQVDEGDVKVGRCCFVIPTLHLHSAVRCFLFINKCRPPPPATQAHGVCAGWPPTSALWSKQRRRDAFIAACPSVSVQSLRGLRHTTMWGRLSRSVSTVWLPHSADCLLMSASP